MYLDGSGKYLSGEMGHYFVWKIPQLTKSQIHERLNPGLYIDEYSQISEIEWIIITLSFERKEMAKIFYKYVFACKQAKYVNVPGPHISLLPHIPYFEDLDNIFKQKV